jgi:hypothetical protein
VLEHYKESLPEKTHRLSDEDIEVVQGIPREIDVLQLVRELEGIPTGGQHASKYHTFIMGALESIFYPSLDNPVKEQEVNEGRKRIDIVFNNGRRGFFDNLVHLHRIKCPYVFFECKNYTNDPENPELDQLMGRFSDKRGEFGILVCRQVKDRRKMLKRCQDIVNDTRRFILVLEDSDIKVLLEFRSRGDFQGLNNYLENMFRDLVM